ncbi:MAG: tetratricopeptide repeat protein [Labilibaculum antarcticum]
MLFSKTILNRVVTFPLLTNRPIIMALLLLSIGIKTVHAEEAKDSLSIVDSLVSTFPYLITDSAEQAKLNVEQALLLNKENSSKVSAFGNYCLGFYSRIKGENRAAIKYHNKALSFYNELENEDRQVLVLNELGIVYKNLSQYEKSIDFYTQGIEIAERIESTRLADVYSNLAVVVTYMKKYDQALQYLFKSYKLEDDTIGKQIILLNIGATYKDNGQDGLAMIYYKKALKVCDDNNLADYYRNDVLYYIANELISNLEYKKGLKYLFEIAEFEEGENNKRDLAHTYLSIASAYKAMQNYDEAIHFFNKSIIFSIETETNDQLLLAYTYLSDIYTKKEYYKKALQYNQKYILLKDSLFNIDKVKYNESLLAEFEADRKEKEILLLKKEKELQEKELQVNERDLKNNRTIRNATIIVSILSVIAVFILVLFYKQKLSNEKLLVQKNEEINKQKIYSLLQDQEVNAIKSEIEGRVNERKRIAQELHDGLGGNLASIKLNLANIIDNYSTKKLRDVMRNIDDTCKEIRDISHNLISVKIQSHTFSYLVRKFLNEILVGKTVQLNLNLYPETELDELPNELKIELYRIIQELMSNVIKYSEANIVDVQILRADKYLNLMLEDNGLGFDTTKATNGIGLKNIHSRIAALNGVCRIESSPGNWTLVNIEIPLT